MEEIEKRLRESTDACIKSFENWVAQSKNLESRETLMEAMHEVRKVISRVEIEIAISERDRLGSRRLPIPPHRSSQKREGGEDGEFGGDDDFNVADGPQPSQNDQPRRQQHHNRGRRPMHGGGGGGNRDRGPNNNPGNNGDGQPQ
jgi:hypothetical protein